MDSLAATEPRRVHANALEASEGGQFFLMAADVPHLPLLEDDLPTVATYVFRVLADLGIVLPQTAEAMVGLARGIAKNYNAIKHYNGGRFPDDTHTYLIGQAAMYVARLYAAKLVLGRSEQKRMSNRSLRGVTL